MNAKVNRLALGMGVMLAALAGQAQAQPPAPSENATINLIRLLVQQGVLKKEQADALVRQAEAEAQQAQHCLLYTSPSPRG
ncbi:putative porin, partial [Pseudomonas aeruginosa]|uniref:putative porin n=1 Tax=Pseudomonas aeruginosa TaxID=287 RepID=UPI003FCF0C3F